MSSGGVQFVGWLVGFVISLMTYLYSVDFACKSGSVGFMLSSAPRYFQVRKVCSSCTLL